MDDSRHLPHSPQPSRLRTFLMKFFGPADLGPEHHGHPLRGTKWDPELQEQRRQARREARLRRRDGGDQTGSS